MVDRVVEELESVTIRFAGDSGDGMQLTGSRFTEQAALVGNDIATFPDFPAEIRAPAGSLPGVSGFQIQFAAKDIFTPGDRPDVLVAMNPAALAVNLKDLPEGGTLFVNEDAFKKGNLRMAGFDENPLEDGSLSNYRLFKVPMTTLTLGAVEGTELGRRVAERCKNFFALGIMFYLYERSLDHTEGWIDKKFGAKPEVAEANKRALHAGFNYADTSEMFGHRYRVKKAALEPGTYRSVTGNQALALGTVAAGQCFDRPVFYGSYPITPASDVLHELARFRGFGVKTFQAEDEIAAIVATVGAAFAGSLAVTATSGPGVSLKSEALGLAVMTELPLVVVNVQRGGPSTGLPTKTEQADLLQAMYCRHGECPMPILAPATPAECFSIMIEAVQMAVKYMTPVMVLSDGYLANGSEPWRVPDVSELPKHPVSFHTDKDSFLPYNRDEKTLARPWAIPGTPGLEHRIGGLEKQDGSGNVSYDPENHQKMTDLRQAKVEGIADSYGPTPINGEQSGDVLVVGWGGTHGAVTSAVERLRRKGASVGQVHLRHLNPLPKDLGEILGRFNKVLVPELNNGQLRLLLRAHYLVDAQGLNKVAGQPFKVSEVMAKIEEMLDAAPVA